MFLHEIRSLEQSQDCLPRDIPRERREWRCVWTVVVDGRHHSDRRVYDCASNARSEDDVRDGVMNVKQGNHEACQEQEDRERLMTRLRNQSALTQTTEDGGFLLDWRREELEPLLARVPFARPSSC